MARPGGARPARERARVQRAAVAMPEESRPAAWLRNFRLSGFAVSVLLLIVAALVVLAPGLKTLIEQRQQIAQLQQSVEDAGNAVDGLNEEIARWSDPAYVEAQARTRLFYVFPGDVTFLVIRDDGPSTSDGLPISDEIQTTKVDWVRALLATVYGAGLTTAPPEQLQSPPTG